MEKRSEYSPLEPKDIQESSFGIERADNTFELQILADFLRKDIELYRSISKAIPVLYECKTGKISGEPIRISQHVNNEYNSIQLKESAQVEGNSEKRVRISSVPAPDIQEIQEEKLNQVIMILFMKI